MFFHIVALLIKCNLVIILSFPVMPCALASLWLLCSKVLVLCRLNLHVSLYLDNFHDTLCHMLSYMHISIIHSGNDNLSKRCAIHAKHAALRWRLGLCSLFFVSVCLWFKKGGLWILAFLDSVNACSEFGHPHFIGELSGTVPNGRIGAVVLWQHQPLWKHSGVSSCVLSVWQ